MDIAVLLPVKNGGKFIAESITSVLNQSCKEFILYISDDASTDNTLAIIRSFRDDRIRIFTRKRPLGQFGNFNFLLKESTEQLVHLWSHDDCMHPECLHQTIRFHQKYPDAGMSYCGSDTIDENGHIIQNWSFDHTPEQLDRKTYARYSLAYGCLAGSISQVCLNRTVTGHSVSFKEQLKHSGDFDLWTRIAENHPIGFIRQSLMDIRQHKQQLSRQYQNIYPAMAEDIALQEKLTGWTGAHPSGQKISIRYLLYAQYFDRALFLLYQGCIVSAFKCLKLIAGKDSLTLIGLQWFSYRFSGIKKGRSKRRRISRQIVELK